MKCERVIEVATTLDRYAIYFKKWNIGAEAGSKIDEVFQNSLIPNDNKVEKVFEILIKDRLSSLNFISRRLMERALNSAFDPAAVDLLSHGGAHYDPFKNLLHFPWTESRKVEDLIVAIHEIEHAFDRNTNPLLWAQGTVFLFLKGVKVMPSNPALTLIFRRMETRAIGAQWELVRKLPPSLRQDLIAEISSRRITNSAAYLAKESLKRATLSKEQFVLELAEIQNYSVKSIYFDDGRSSFEMGRNLLKGFLALWSGRYIYRYFRDKLDQKTIVKSTADQLLIEN
ncbi:MAG: hypothetical protein HOE90_23430 [Bacteriovoracaceae bacterium]|jgi:hypothetical protein|nr:hypothetical protein [Bacteriovoracaceae bacterium]